MTRTAAGLLLLAPALLAASAPVPVPGEPLDSALQRARAEQRAATAEAERLEKIAAAARNEAAQLQAQQAAATSAIEAAEARITAADAQLRLVSAAADQRRERLRREQGPIAALLSGLVMMARRPPLLAIADQGGTDDLVKVRILLDSTMPVIRRRTASLSAELAESERTETVAAAARDELVRSRRDLVRERQRFAALEARVLAQSASARGEALSAGDVALAAGENVAQLKGKEGGARAAWAIASELAASDPAPPRPTAPESRRRPALTYVLPVAAPVTEGLGTVSATGIRSRGLSLATRRGMPVVVPASGTIRFSGPYRSHDGVVIIDHGNGWISLLVGVASPLKAGQRVRLGESLGRTLGPIQVELSQNGQRVSPALIAGSSRTLSNAREGG
ncbi:MAG TPA: peptidoglycan DD-metalloendopeptidase family protein [Sphingomicrobium sp.]|nr:peptidoglycan DD-metalloendopeptidase family protein [Sphingomicrobium sp.]